VDCGVSVQALVASTQPLQPVYWHCVVCPAPFGTVVAVQDLAFANGVVATVWQGAAPEPVGQVVASTQVLPGVH
jgi:hypothetical protein